MAARSRLVRMHRAGLGGWSRIDTPADPWYRPEQWTDDGAYLAEAAVIGKSQSQSHAAESHGQSQPWVEAGVSRATWFRRLQKGLPE